MPSKARRTGHERAGLSTSGNTGNAKGVGESPNPDLGRVNNQVNDQHNEYYLRVKGNVGSKTTSD
jgi:hypothetical protein